VVIPQLGSSSVEAAPQARATAYPIGRAAARPVSVGSAIRSTTANLGITAMRTARRQPLDGRNLQASADPAPLDCRRLHRHMTAVPENRRLFTVISLVIDLDRRVQVE
jgi:hypothetical protein